MAPRRTEIYQPADSTPEYDPLGEDGQLGDHRLPRLIVGALLGLAALATVVWFGYEHSLDRGAAEAVIISPPPGPVRTKPDDPGGESQLYAGLKVYAPPQPGEGPSEVSRLSPVSSDVTALAAANPSAGVDHSPAATVAPEVFVTPEYLQIGSYPTQELAEKAFRQFRGAHGDLAGDFLPDIKKTDLGGKGVWYRLRIGPFAGTKAAAESCEKMKKEGVTCLIAAR